MTDSVHMPATVFLIFNLFCLASTLAKGSTLGSLRSSRLLRRSAQHVFQTPEDSIYQELEGLIQQELSKAQPNKNESQAVIAKEAPIDDETVSLNSMSNTMPISDADLADADAIETEVDHQSVKTGSKVDDEKETSDEDHHPISNEDDLAVEFSKWIKKRHENHNPSKKRIDDHDNSAVIDGQDSTAQQEKHVGKKSYTDTALSEELELVDHRGRLEREQASAEEEFLFSAAKKALEGKDKALAEAAHNADLEKDAEQRLQIADQLLKDVEKKKRNALKLAAESAKSEKKKAEEAASLALTHTAAYERQLEKGKQERDEVDRAKVLKEKFTHEQEVLSKELSTLKERSEQQEAVAASAEAEALEERRLADKVDSVLGERDRVQDLKDAARAAAESRKKLENEFRSRVPEELDGEEFPQGLLGESVEENISGKLDDSEKNKLDHSEKKELDESEKKELSE